MDAITVMTNIIHILFGGISTSAVDFANGINDLMSHLFLAYSDGAVTSNLTPFAVFVCIFGGISLCIGIGRLVVKFFTGWGKNRYM